MRMLMLAAALGGLLMAMMVVVPQSKKDKLRDPWKNDPCPPTWCDTAGPDLGDTPYIP